MALKRHLEFFILFIFIVSTGFILNSLVIGELPAIKISDTALTMLISIMIGAPTLIGGIILAIVILNWRSLVDAIKEMLSREPVDKPREKKKSSHFLTIILYILVLGAIYLATRRLREPSSISLNESLVEQYYTPMQDIFEDTPYIKGMGIIGILIYVAVILTLVFVTIIAIYEYRQSKLVQIELDIAMRRDISKVVKEALRSYKSGDDIRDVIIDTYLKMVDIIRKRGVKEMPEETAREYRKRIIRLLPLPENYINDLTFLFEEARYSNHVLGEDHVERAINALEGIRRYVEFE